MLYCPLATVECCTAFALAVASVSTLRWSTFMILMPFDPRSIQMVRISIFLEGDIRLAMGLCRLRRYEFNESGQAGSLGLPA